MISEYKCPDFQFNTIEDEFGNEKIFFKANNAKLIFYDDEVYDISDIELYILNDIKVDFVLNEKIEKYYNQFNIEFESSDGWKIIIEKCYFTFFKDMYLTSAEGLKVIITKGHCSKDTPVRYYKFIENLNLIKECEINEIACTELDNLFLIKHNDNIFKNIDGYFYTKDICNNINSDVFKNLYFLLKYYSAESASMRISYCLADDYQKIEITAPSQYSNFKYESCFHDTYPKAFINFLNSAYGTYVKLKDESKIDVNLLIHYLAFLRRERYMEVELLISSIILEVLTKNLKKVKDSSEAKFSSDLKKLLIKLNLDFEKLDKFFKAQNVACKDNTFLSEIVNARNTIVHGNAVVSEKLNFLMSTFANILALRLFNIDCVMYVPLIRENVFTRKFVGQFILSDEKNEKKSKNLEIEDNKVEIVDIYGGLFLPLNIFEDLINEKDQFHLIEFETKESGEECKLNLKMARFVKD